MYVARVPLKNLKNVDSHSDSPPHQGSDLTLSEGNVSIIIMDTFFKGDNDARRRGTTEWIQGQV